MEKDRDLATPCLPGASLRKVTSFSAAVYEGWIVHDSNNDRSNSYVETVPIDEREPGTVFVLCGGYTSSSVHYELPQRRLAELGIRSVHVGHDKHRGYTLGHNADDIAATCMALLAAQRSRIVLVGHSRGAPEALEAHEQLRRERIGGVVSDIVLAQSAQQIEGLISKIPFTLPLFIGETVLNIIRNPIQQARHGFRTITNIATDTDRIFREGVHLLIHTTGRDELSAVSSHPDRPRLHLLFSTSDGLVPARSAAKSVRDSHYDTLVLVPGGHNLISTDPVFMDYVYDCTVRSVV